MSSLEFHVSVKRETQLSVKVCEVKKQEMDWREIKKTEKGRDKETNRSGNREREREREREKERERERETERDTELRKK